ncbi:MAG: hypothetical protein HY093_04465 [Candidatus Liptonbacteria bacterium]|nr:hypothetical protein [Candidatus Liptonbacteria bacterium]
MVDLKKLVTSFLVLAIGISSAVFVFSNFYSKSGVAPTVQVEESGGKSAANLNALSGNAFVESVPKQAPTVEGDQKQAEVGQNFPPVSDPSNLTENLAQKLTQEMGGLDPTDGGLISDKVNAISPKVLDYAGKIVDLGAIQKESDKIAGEIEAQSGNFEISKNFTPADVESYKEVLSLAIDENFNQSGVIELLGNVPSPQAISSLELVLDQFLLKGKSMTVPEAVADFHRSLLKLTIYEKTMLGLAYENTDPLKASLVLQLQKIKYNQAIQDVSRESQKVQSLEKTSNQGGHKLLGDLLSSLILPQKAYAVIPVIDPTHIAISVVNLAKTIGNIIAKVATEELKHKLVHMMVEQTINWIQGGGKPKFVQDFKGFVLGEADKAFGNEIYQHLPGLCSRIQPWVALTYYQAPKQRQLGFTNQTRCTVSQVVENVTAFYDSLQQGGWKNYLEVIRPQNNYFGAVIQLHDLALTRSAQQQQATELKVGSGQGFLTTKVCKKWSSLNLNDLMGPPSGDPEADARSMAEGAGFDYVGPVQSDNSFGVCYPDGWQDTTPGKQVGETLAKAAGLNADTIVNAQDAIALVSVFVDSLINRIFQTGAEGLLGVVAGGSGVDIQKSCDSYLQNTPPDNAGYNACIGLANDIATTYESGALPISTILQSATAYKEQYKKIIAADNSYLNDAPLAIAVIQNVLSSCPKLQPSDVAEYQKRVKVINDNSAPGGLLFTEKESASSSIGQLNDFETRANAAATSLEKAQLAYEFQARFDATFIQQQVDTAEARYQELKTWWAEAAYIWSTRNNPIINVCL